MKNGDRWTVRAVHPDGALTAQHLQHRPAGAAARRLRRRAGRARLRHHRARRPRRHRRHHARPADRRRGPAAAVHDATRGRHANHLYLQVVGDGDPHTVIRPELIHPPPPPTSSKQILARDGAARSATTQQRDQHNPAVRLGDAAARYLDALHVAATRPRRTRSSSTQLDAAAEQIAAGLTDEPAWPTLRAHLLLLHADGHDPIRLLHAAAAVRELDSADRPGRRPRPPTPPTRT